MNLFSVDTQAVQYLIETIGKDVFLNSNPRRMLVSHTPINPEYDDLKITSLSLLRRGDMIDWDGEKYLIISEVNGERHGKYTALMRKTNYTILFQVGIERVLVGHDSLGRPVYEDHPVYADVPCIVESETVELTAQGGINPATGKIRVTMQKNDSTERIALNNTFAIMGINWKITNIDDTKVGLRIVRAERI